MKRIRVLVLLLFAMLLAHPIGAAVERAQVRVGLCSLEAPPEGAAALRALAGRAWTILPQVESDLGLRAAARWRMILIPPGVPADSEIAKIEEIAPPWAAGLMMPGPRIGAIFLERASRYPYGTLEAVLAHEATHLLIADGTGERVPLWFNEGVATWQGRRWNLEDMVVYTGSLLTSDLPHFAALDASFNASQDEAQLAYAASFAFVSWNARRHGREAVRTILRESRTRGFERAWRIGTGTTLERSEAAWRRESLIRYRWLPILTASSTLWIAITFLGFAAGVRKRARAQRLREQWEREEREEQAEAEAGIEPEWKAVPPAEPERERDP